jgi:phosphonate transport system permease protein
MPRPSVYVLSGGKEIRKPRAYALKLAAASFVLILVLALPILKFEPASLEDLGGLFSLLGLMFAPPDIAYFPSLLMPMLQTLKVALLGTAIGFVFALVLSAAAARTVVKTPWVRRVATTLMSFVRTMPELILATLFVVFFGPGETSGILALAVYSTGFLSKGFYEGFELINTEPLEVIESAGGGLLEKMSYAVLPLSSPNLVSYTSYAFEMNVRSAAIIGYVGAGGIGAEYNLALAFGRYPRVGSIILLTLLVVFAMDNASNYVRSRFL